VIFSGYDIHESHQAGHVKQESSVAFHDLPLELLHIARALAVEDFGLLWSD
jgi:hypothetical protein